jgi:hypothetical protein
MDMDASAELRARRDQLIRDAKEVLLPFKQWWMQHGVPFNAATRASYFNQQLGTWLHEAEAEIEGLARQHPRFITAIQLSNFEKHFTALPDSWWWLLREARLFETLRREVKPTDLEPHAILQEIRLCVDDMSGAWRQVQAVPPYSRGILELDSLTRELAFVADVTIQLGRSATELMQDDPLGYGRDFPPTYRFKLEHDWLYLKFLRVRNGELAAQFFAVHRTASALMLRISEALPEWYDMLSCLQSSPLTAYAWHCHGDLQALSTSQDLSLPALQRAYDETYLAVQEANQA